MSSTAEYSDTFEISTSLIFAKVCFKLDVIFQVFYGNICEFLWALVGQNWYKGFSFLSPNPTPKSLSKLIDMQKKSKIMGACLTLKPIARFGLMAVGTPLKCMKNGFLMDGSEHCSEIHEKCLFLKIKKMKILKWVFFFQFCSKI